MDDMRTQIEARMELAHLRTRRIVEKKMLEILKKYGFIIEFEYRDDFTFAFDTKDVVFKKLLHDSLEGEKNGLRAYIVSHNKDCADEIDELFCDSIGIFKRQVKDIFGETAIFADDLIGQGEDN